MKLEYEPDLTNMSETVASMISTIGDIPFGYRVADGYAYYCDDYIEEEIIEGYDLKSSSIYRLNLNDPSAEPELLVKNGCWYMQLLGVAGGKLYYEPNIYYENGLVAKTIAVVDLSTLELETVAENEYTIPNTSGLSIDDVVLTSEFILGKNVKDVDFYLIYHFETGDLMYISNEFDRGKIVKGE